MTSNAFTQWSWTVFSVFSIEINRERKSLTIYWFCPAVQYISFDRAQRLTQNLLKQDNFASTLVSSILKKNHTRSLSRTGHCWLLRTIHFSFVVDFFSSITTFTGLDHEKNGGWHKKQELPTLREHMSSPIYVTLYSLHILIACLPWSRYELL